VVTPAEQTHGRVITLWPGRAAATWTRGEPFWRWPRVERHSIPRAFGVAVGWRWTALILVVVGPRDERAS
jgi:hypothetical protein